MHAASALQSPVCVDLQSLFVSVYARSRTVYVTAGLLIAYISDTSLHAFVTANKRRQAAGQPKLQLLQTGKQLPQLPALSTSLL